MTLHLGLPHAHHRSTEQQQEIREAKRLLKERIQDDWDYPPLPAFQSPVRRSKTAGGGVEETIAGFKFHTPSNYTTQAVASGAPAHVDFEPVDWREREYSSDESETESPSSTNSRDSKPRGYRFEGPDSVAAQISDRKHARKMKQQEALDKEVTWNDGLAHWLARRDVWCCAHTAQQVQVLESGTDVHASSSSASIASTPRTSTSSTTSVTASPVVSSPSTTPELVTEQPVVNTIPPAPSSEVLVPVAPPILVNHPIRRRITPDIYPEIYTKIILQSRTPSVPINLAVLIKALIQGWKDDGEWPPKQGPVEKSVGRKKSSGHESALKHGVKAVGRVLRITGGESSMSSNAKEKG
ncbi:hypothetical protein LTR37_002995 [Vermiconidia calcicola]|uniref:Uncharacterized protein n=1 Tax=Vermiconidia calcicola TaxID=1690605 RepID=A0ACC3NRS7_9PEZI|nr:hypothetical protein LTR37_002995 [Vermiconidia calcicola]